MVLVSQTLVVSRSFSLQQGLNPRFVLITNPTNRKCVYLISHLHFDRSIDLVHVVLPFSLMHFYKTRTRTHAHFTALGVIYSPTIIKNIITWARKRGLHTIVDEIYALSTHQATGHGFESVIKVMDNQLGNDVHMVWSISKDFGASGLRVGLIYTQNQLLVEGLATLNIFRGVSGPIQMVVSELLTDDDFVDKYLQESRNRLLYSYHICTCKLEEMVIPYIQATAGQFVYIDCTSLLPKPTFEYEQQLFQLISDYAHVVLTPGENQRERTPGMFRICYACK